MRGSAVPPYSSTIMCCKECGKTDCMVMDYGAGDLTCIKCGCVAARGVEDEGEDWRAYSNGKAVKGAQHVVTYGELGSTEITCRRPNMVCPPGSHPKTKMSEKRLARGLQSIQSICSRLFFQRIVVDTARSVLRSAILIPFLVTTFGKRRQAFVTATIVIASRKHACARSLKEVSAATGTDWKSVAKCYTRIVEKLKLRIKPQKADEYVRRYCSLLRMSRAISEVAAPLTTRYAASGSPRSANPTAIAGAAILFTCSMSKQRKEAKRVAAVAFISDRLLLRIYADMYSKLNELFATEDLIYLQEQGLDMRQLPRPDVVAVWKNPNSGGATAPSRKRRSSAAPVPRFGADLNQPRDKIARSRK